MFSRLFASARPRLSPTTLRRVGLITTATAATSTLAYAHLSSSRLYLDSEALPQLSSRKEQGRYPVSPKEATVVEPVASSRADESSSTNTPTGGEGSEEIKVEGPFNHETGEFNWDCPCLGGMADGPCGEDFKTSFSCFYTLSEEDDLGKCVGDFEKLQQCFRRYPEHYKEEIEEDERTNRKLEQLEEAGLDILESLPHLVNPSADPSLSPLERLEGLHTKLPKEDRDGVELLQEMVDEVTELVKESVLATPPREGPRGEDEFVGAYNSVTKEFNWDCPCLNGLPNSVCGPQFKDSFRAFILSSEEGEAIDPAEMERYHDALVECFEKMERDQQLQQEAGGGSERAEAVV